MKTKRQKIKELEEENRQLKSKIGDLNSELMITRMRSQMERSYLLHNLLRAENNPEIRLPGNESIFYKDLNDAQLSYLDSLKENNEKGKH